MQQYRPDIDGLRAVAVLAVVLYHLGVPGFNGGFVGVDIFFVISGYLITGLVAHDLDRGAFTFRDFYGRRVRRILPALLATLAACAITAPLFLAPVHLASFGASLVAAIASVSNVYFWTQSGYFDAAAELKPLLHTWSLGVEEQFYLLWPAMLLFLAGKSRWLAPAVSVGLVVAGCLIGEVWLRSDPAAAFYLLPSRLGELALGAALVWLPANRGPLAARLFGFTSGLAFVAIAIATFNERTPFPGMAALVPCLGTALVIACRPDRGWLSFLLENPVATQVGRMSYSIYLVHWPVIVFWHYYRYAPLNDFDRAGAAILTGVLATALYHFVERPFRSKRDGDWSISTRRLLAWVGSGSTALAALGLLAAMLQGQVVARPEANIPLIVNLQEFAKEGPALVPLETADVLLLGDSHADHYTNALLASTEAAGLTMARSIKPGCPPLISQPETLRKALDADQSDCVQQLANWATDVERFDGKIVVLASRWSMLTEPSHYGRYRVRRHWLLLDPADPNDLDGPRQRLRASLRATVEALIAQGKHVLLMGQMPETGTDLNACYAAPTLILPDPASRCVSVPSREMIDRLKFSNGLLAELASDFGGKVDAYFASRIVCPEGSCNLTLDGVLIYRNEDHITDAASLRLAGTLSPFFKGLN